jgi:hypothetical protein
MFRVSQRGEGIDDAGSIDGAREIVRGRPPGRVVPSATPSILAHEPGRSALIRVPSVAEVLSHAGARRSQETR